MRKSQDDLIEDHMYLQYKNTKLSDKCVKLESCGEGGFGSVDAYYDHNLQKVIAVKKLARYTNYLQEKRRLINLKKRQFEFVNDLIGFCDEERILMFELGEATLLEIDDMFQDDGYIWREIDLIYIAWNLLVGLKYLREIKSFHGDISPNNIMFFMDKVKYIDLGSSEINKNAQYLQQYKMEFVNHEIRKNRQNYKYSDDDITQNEMFTLGKTLLYLAFNNEVDKRAYIMDVDKKSQKALIEMQKSHFYELVAHDELSSTYPKLKNIILKMMYPFDVDLIDDNQTQKKNNNPENDEDSSIFKEPQKIKKQKQECEIERQNSNKRFQKINGKMSVEKEYADQEDEEEEKKIDFIQNTVEIKTINNEPQTVELGTIQIQTKNYDMEDEEEFDQDEEIDEDFEEDEEEDDSKKKQKKKGKQNVNKNANKNQSNIDKVVDELIHALRSILEVNYDSEDNFAKVIEESDQIKVALFKIRQKRIDELLEKHNDPQRELVYLSTMSAEDWRKELAQSMIQDILNSQANTGINKQCIQRMIHEKILRIQMRILAKKIQIEDSFIDAIKDLYTICKNNKEYHSLIECNYTLFLIYSFLKLTEDADKQLKLAEEKTNQNGYQAKYQGSLTKNKIQDSSSGNMDTIRYYIEDQLHELRNNNYKIIY